MIDAIVEKLKTADSFLITSHINPEGDSTGSVFAMQALLNVLEKKSVVVCQDPIPRNLSFLNKTWVERHAVSQEVDYDWAIVLDAPVLNRIGTVAELITDPKKVMVIDHHISNQNYGELNWVDPNASSCGEMMALLFEAMKVPLDESIAALLYTAISTDTGSFKYSNTSALTHAIIASLIQTGLNTAEINEALYSNTPLEKMKLHNTILSNVHFDGEKRVAWCTVSKEDLQKCNAQKTDCEGIIEQIRDIEGVKIAFFVSTIAEGKPLKISFRARRGYDVNIIAQHFHGGGHAQAAGCSIDDTVQSATKIIVDLAKEQLD